MKTPNIHVLSHIAGSKVVVMLGSNEHYVDVRVDVHYPGMSFIELVRNGQVVRGETVVDALAPEAIMVLVRQALGVPAITHRF